MQRFLANCIRSLVSYALVFRISVLPQRGSGFTNVWVRVPPGLEDIYSPVGR